MKQEDFIIHYNLLKLPGLGPKTLRLLYQQFSSPSQLINASNSQLKAIPFLNNKMYKSLSQYQHDTKEAKKEWAFCQKHGIRPIGINESDFPQRLLPIDDAPTLMYFLGKASLNAPKTVAIIGTRTNSEYGKIITREIVKQLEGNDIQIISGLAAGIDGIAHQSALDSGLSTIGILGHGLDIMYPEEHRSLAQQMIKNGGLLSEYPSNSIPHKANFPMRNRIVAAISDFLLVVETKEKGGAMITAHLGFGYNKEIGAIPGQIHHVNAKGCNKLIKNNIAHLIESGQNILEIMNWDITTKKKSVQKELFEQLNQSEQSILTLLQTNQQLHFDDLLHQTQLSYSTLSSTLLNLEMHDYIQSLPGKLYQMAITI